MTDDLIKRLKRKKKIWYIDDLIDGPDPLNPDGPAAIDALKAKDKRIAELEARHDECFQIWDNYRKETNARIDELEAQLKGDRTDHYSDCAVNNAPALPVGPCDCLETARARISELEARTILTHESVAKIIDDYPISAPRTRSYGLIS